MVKKIITLQRIISAPRIIKRRCKEALESTYVEENTGKPVANTSEDEALTDKNANKTAEIRSNLYLPDLLIFIPKQYLAIEK
jgi:hypothetical protein